MSLKLAVVFAEFGKPKPNTTEAQKYFPEADIRIYGDGDVNDLFAGHARRGWRQNDYWKVRKLLDSEADIGIAFDSDMKIVSENVKVLPALIDRFGICLPANPRKLVAIDTKIGADSDGVLDETKGMGYAYNCTPIGINLRYGLAIRCAERFCEIMLKKPVRGPLAWWRAAWDTGFAPYLLPPQWCVCGDDIGVGNEIILHVGHDAVRKHYLHRYSGANR